MKRCGEVVFLVVVEISMSGWAPENHVNSLESAGGCPC